MSGAQFAWHSIELFILAKEEWIVWLRVLCSLPFCYNQVLPCTLLCRCQPPIQGDRRRGCDLPRGRGWSPRGCRLRAGLTRRGRRPMRFRGWSPQSCIWSVTNSPKFSFETLLIRRRGLSAATQEVAVWEVASPWFRGLYQSGTRGQLHRLRYKT